MDEDKVFDSEDTADDNETVKKKRVFKEVLSWLMVIAVGVGAAFVMSNFVIVNANVPSGSMLDTIEVDSRIVAFRLSYIFSEPERQDVVVFRYPLNEDKLFVKRIIGLPGETVEIIDGRVYVFEGSVRGEPLEEDYLGSTRRENIGPVVVPANSFFVMGDYRANSEDSRMWSRQGVFLQSEAILGRVIFSYYPTIRMIR